MFTVQFARLTCNLNVRAQGIRDYCIAIRVTIQKYEKFEQKKPDTLVKVRTPKPRNVNIADDLILFIYDVLHVFQLNQKSGQKPKSSDMFTWTNGNPILVIGMPLALKDSSFATFPCSLYDFYIALHVCERDRKHVSFGL